MPLRSQFQSRFLDLAGAAQTALVVGLRDLTRVRGFTHGYYKYPARFSPVFARAAIQSLTQPGDWVIDNHVGGGTTLVEAMALGRNAIGIDISTLAEFVTTVKTTVFEPYELATLKCWTARLHAAISVRKSSARMHDYDELGYYRHLDHPHRWRIRKAIEQALRSGQRLAEPRVRAFARCVVLRTSQWALDGRKNTPSLSEFRLGLIETAETMIEAARVFAAAVKAHQTRPTAVVMNRSAAGMERDPRMQKQPAPKLVITSPPYPGIHVLYHRWQIDGGKEAPLPFMIAGKLDGAGSSYYTMGDRKYPELRTYFDGVRASMQSVAALADEETVVLQLLAFSDAKWQLPRYLEAMEQAGLTEFFLPQLHRQGDGRLWRTVPGRRWYSDQRGQTPGSAEVLLIHRKRD
jgi:hypothetical protein